MDLLPPLLDDFNFHLQQDQCVLSLCSGHTPVRRAGTGTAHSMCCGLLSLLPCPNRTLLTRHLRGSLLGFGRGALSSQLSRTSHPSHLCSIVPSGVFTHVFFLLCLLRRILILSTNLLPYAQPYLTCALPSLQAASCPSLEVLLPAQPPNILQGDSFWDTQRSSMHLFYTEKWCRDYKSTHIFLFTSSLAGFAQNGVMACFRSVGSVCT